MANAKSNASFFKKGSDFFITLYLSIEEIIKLFFLELQLAKRSFIVAIICSVAFAFLIFSLWLLTLLIFILLLHNLFQDWLMPVIFVMGINLLCAGMVLWCIALRLKDLKFSFTRKHLFGKKEMHEDSGP